MEATTSLELELTGQQGAMFAMRCRWLGRRSEQFQLTISQTPIGQAVRVSLLPYGGQRTYHLDHFLDWLDVFELDLQAGKFDDQPRHPWA